MRGRNAKQDESRESRIRLLREMEKRGINTATLESLTLPQLADLVYGMNKMANSNKQGLEITRRHAKAGCRYLFRQWIKRS